MGNAAQLRASGVRVVDAPLALPQGARLRIVRDERMVPDVEALLRNFAPQVKVAGFRDVAELEAPLEDSETLLVCSSAWPSLLERLGQRPRSDVSEALVLLLPEDYVWGYADFARSLPGWPARTGDVVVSTSEGRAHLSRWGKTEVRDDGSIGETDGDTLGLFKERAARQSRALLDLRSRLADAESVQVVDRLMFGTLEDTFKHFSGRVFKNVQYLECNQLFPEMVIINGGVQEGFELPYYMAHTAGTARMLCVDPSGFEHLGPFARAAAEHYAENLHVVPRALWSRSGDVALPVCNGTVMSQFKGLNEFPEFVFNCTSIDDLVADHALSAVDLIKLDVEGAEPEVLLGAQGTLVEHRPQLAISVYHWPEHVWEIPLFLMNTLPDYDYYLRHYSFGRWECILYAIPKPGTSPRLDRHRQR